MTTLELPPGVEMRARQAVEQRDPSVATTGIGYTAVGQPMIPEWDAETAIRMGYMANVYVFRCIQVIAQAVAGLPFRMGADPGKPGSYDVKDPLARLLGPAPGGPAPGLTPSRLWAFLVASYLATGRFACEIEEKPNSQDIAALWPLVTSNLAATPTAGGNAWFSKFTYGQGRQSKDLRPDQVWYEWRPSQLDFRQPESCLSSARLPVSTLVMLDRYAYSFLVNDARPASVIVHQVFENGQEREAWRSQFLAAHRGALNAGKPLFAEVDSDDGKVDGSISVIPVGLSQRESEFIAQMEQMIRAVCAAFGTPRSKLANSSESTFSNADQDDINWWRDMVKPLLSELADSVNIHLAPRFGDNVGWFDISRVQQLQSSKLLALGRALPMMVGVTVMADEVRAEVDLPPLPNGAGQYCTGGNPALVPPTQQEAGQLAVAATAAERAEDTEGEGPTPTAPPAPTADVPPPRVVAMPEQRDDEPAPPTAEERETVRREYRRQEWRRVDAHVRTLESMFANQMRHLFAEQARVVAGKLGANRRRLAQIEKREHRISIDPAALFDAAMWEKRTAETAASILNGVIAQSGSRVAGQFAHAAHAAGVDVVAKVSPDSPLASEFVQARANKLAGQVTDTTYGAIKDAITAGIGAGEGIDDIGARISHVFDVASSSRADMIARTETVSAYNGATELYGRVLGADVVGGQEWISTLDDRTRPDHADADGQRVAVGDSFSVGGEDLAYPGDPDGPADEVVNCRCTTGLLTPDEMDDSERLSWAAKKNERRAVRARALLFALETRRRERTSA